MLKLFCALLAIACFGLAHAAPRPAKTVKRCGELSACDECEIRYVGRCTSKGLQGQGEVLVIHPDGKRRKAFSTFANDESQGLYLNIYPTDYYAMPGTPPKHPDQVTFNLTVPLPNGQTSRVYGWRQTTDLDTVDAPTTWYFKASEESALDPTPLTSDQVMARLQALPYKQPSLPLDVLKGLFDGSHTLMSTTSDGAATTSSAPVPERRAVAPPVAPPVGPAKPADAGTPSAGQRRIRSHGRTLLIPAGYDAVDDAHLHTVTAETLGAPMWIVGRDLDEARQVGNTLYGFYSRFNACLAGESCAGDDGVNLPVSQLLHLDFGWVAIVQAFQAGSSTSSRQSKVLFVAGAPSRQVAIDEVLDDYRENRGGTVIQTLRVGLVSRVDWARVENEVRARAAAVTDGYWVPEMSELNYKTTCSWNERGNNEDPGVPRGSLEQDPACQVQYRPDEKMPPPVFKVSP